MMGIGGAICAGVFVTIGYAATLAGTALIIVMILCGIINFFTMLSYAELGAALPSAGGEYTFAKVSYGGFFAFSTGWFEWISNMFYASFSAVGFAVLVSYILPTVSVPLLAVLTVVAFTIVNVRGVKETGITQTALVLILLGLLTLFICLGFFIGPSTGNLAISSPTGAMGVLRASAFVFVVYLGGEAIAVAQAEVKDPGKTIPRAIILTCIVLMVVYTATSYVVFKIVPAEGLAGQTSPLAYVAEQFLGSTGVFMITLAGIIAALSSVNTSTMAQSRVAYALARDGYFPKAFHHLHERFATPYIAVIVGSVCVAAVAATGIVNFVTYATDFGFMIGFVFVNLSLMKLRRGKSDLHRPFKVPLYPLTPLLGIASSILLMAFLEIGTLVIGIELLLLGLLAYYLRMVGHLRLLMAMGGINFAVGGFATLIASLVFTDAMPMAITFTTKILLFAFTLTIGLTCIGAGVLQVTAHRPGGKRVA